MAKPFVMTVTNTNRDEENEDEGACVRTPAVPIFFPHHHLLILFSSREEGNSLAEAEAALSARVVHRL